MIVQMSDLNDERFGRFGNQLFKFFFLKIIENELKAEIRYSNWLGNIAFNIKESPPIESTDNILAFDPSQTWTLNSALGAIRNLDCTVIDIKGFFQFHTAELNPYIDLFHNTFKVIPELKTKIFEALNNSIYKNKNIISVHLRRGDYLGYEDNPLFWTTSIKSIVDGLKYIKSSGFRNELIYLASDDISFCKNQFEFEGIEYITADNLFSFNDEGSRLLVDFTIFSIACANIISNSSLSFFGSLLNKHSQIFLRPLPNTEVLAPFAPWNSAVLLRK